MSRYKKHGLHNPYNHQIGVKIDATLFREYVMEYQRAIEEAMEFAPDMVPMKDEEIAFFRTAPIFVDCGNNKKECGTSLPNCFLTREPVERFINSVRIDYDWSSIQMKPLPKNASAQDIYKSPLLIIRCYKGFGSLKYTPLFKSDRFNRSLVLYLMSKPIKLTFRAFTGNAEKDTKKFLERMGETYHNKSWRFQTALEHVTKQVQIWKKNIIEDYMVASSIN